MDGVPAISAEIVPFNSQTSPPNSCFVLFCLLREAERDIDLLFHLFMHSFVVSFMCPDLGLNLQPWQVDDALSSKQLS